MDSYSSKGGGRTLISLKEMRMYVNRNIRIELHDGKVFEGYCPYVMQKEPGEDEENAIFIDTNDEKYSLDQPDIKSIEILD